MNSPCRLQLFCLSACYCSSAKLKYSSSVSFHWIVSLSSNNVLPPSLFKCRLGSVFVRETQFSIANYWLISGEIQCMANCNLAHITFCLLDEKTVMLPFTTLWLPVRSSVFGILVRDGSWSKNSLRNRRVGGRLAAVAVTCAMRLCRVEWWRGELATVVCGGQWSGCKVQMARGGE
jgi:hypothetical protein